MVLKNHIDTHMHHGIDSTKVTTKVIIRFDLSLSYLSSMKVTSGAEFDLPLVWNLDLSEETKGLMKLWFLIIDLTRMRVSSLGTVRTQSSTSVSVTSSSSEQFSSSVARGKTPKPVTQSWV